MENNNGLVDPSVFAEKEFQVSIATMIRIVGLSARAEAARLIMDQVIEAYKTLADVEQQKMDIEMSAICEAYGQKLPMPYDFKVDQDKMTLAIRKR